MKPTQLVLSYGCPRTGTTFMWKLLMQCVGIITVKISEHNIIHPALTDDGLFAINHLFKSQYPLFVRTTRNPIEIFESIYLREAAGQRRIPDRVIYKWIRNESANTKHQFARKHGLRTITVRYESLFTDEGRTQFLDELVAHLPDSRNQYAVLTKYYQKIFNKISVRGGRLSIRQSGNVELAEKQFVDAEKRAEIVENLKDVFIAEGYAYD